MGPIFFDITIIICLASLLTILFRLLKQPPILAYLLTGILLGPLHLFPITSSDSLAALGQFGVTLLLFMLGLELRPKELESTGKISLVLGSMQVIISFVVGFFLASFLGFPLQSAAYLAIALSFSSTIVLVKFLSDKKDLSSLHGKLTLGVLLVQDFVALIAIIFLSSSNSFPTSALAASSTLLILKMVVLLGWIIVLSRYVFPSLLQKIAHNSETLFLFSLGWVFAVALLVSSPLFGLSLEIGGFLAGIALANTQQNFQIVARMRSLRDFFITIFFVMLGLEMHLVSISDIILPVILLSFFVLFIKPIITMALCGFLGYRKRTGFFVGIAMAQISEFSLIIMFLGSRLGQFDQKAVSSIVVVSIISFGLSAYFMQHADSIYRRINKFLDIFEKYRFRHERTGVSEPSLEDLHNHVVIVGADQMGENILHALDGENRQVVVIDFNPDVVSKQKEKGVNILYGDISDTEMQERIKLAEASLVVSTIPDPEDNLNLLSAVSKKGKHPKVIVVALEAHDAKMLYKAGADYVVMPHVAGGRHLAKILLDDDHLDLIERYKARDLATL